MAVCWICSDYDDYIRCRYGIECLRTCGGAECGFQPISGRRMAHASAGINVVVAEDRSHELLNQECLFIRAARGSDASDRAGAVLRLNPFELARDVVDGFFPGDFFPRILDTRADHRFENAIRMGRVADGEPAFHTRMSVIRVPVLIRD